MKDAFRERGAVRSVGSVFEALGRPDLYTRSDAEQKASRGKPGDIPLLLGERDSALRVHVDLRAVFGKTAEKLARVGTIEGLLAECVEDVLEVRGMVAEEASLEATEHDELAGIVDDELITQTMWNGESTLGVYGVLELAEEVCHRITRFLYWMGE